MSKIKIMFEDDNEERFVVGIVITPEALQSNQQGFIAEGLKQSIWAFLKKYDEIYGTDFKNYSVIIDEQRT